jgi:hypothetical protein
VGTEIGAQIRGDAGAGSKAKRQDDRARPLKLAGDDDLAPPVRAFYETLSRATTRRAWVTRGNVEMVLRQLDPGGALYVSLLNWDFRDPMETNVVVRGEYDTITDLSIEGGFPVSGAIGDGLTRFPIVMGPGEGLMLKLE